MRVLIIGGDGLIGEALKRRLAARGHDVIATTRHSDRVDARTIYLDIGEPKASEIDELPVADVAIFCAGMSRFSECRKFPELAERVNVTGPTQIATRLITRGTRVLRLSSSSVFSCTIPRVAADHPVSPRGVYGRLQADAERAVLALGPRAGVIRLTKVVTPQFSLFRNWMSALSEEKRIEAFSDHGVSPVSLETGVEAIKAIAEQNKGGIFQVSGSGDISYEELARWLVRSVGLSSDRVVAVRAAGDKLLSEEVTRFTSMDTSRLEALTGYVPQDPLIVFAETFGPELKGFRAAPTALNHGVSL